ncbi:uncharacterized protein A4U43_C10F19300 [Asparagus officinalis]|uniref:Uncharacterized protein n=1 Tax=Asparagus officinalis TaxID=4686 RepID=A0A5P1E3Z5_ASPOF|nr:uncharacterized protein A4U43_C10F19300 [Asparagus officinalis]
MLCMSKNQKKGKRRARFLPRFRISSESWRISKARTRRRRRKREAMLKPARRKDDAEAKASEPEDAVDAKRQRLDDEGVDGLDGGQDVQKEDAQLAGQQETSRKI